MLGKTLGGGIVAVYESSETHKMNWVVKSPSPSEKIKLIIISRRLGRIGESG